MNNDIISNCLLCDNHSLHLIGEDKYQMQQCVYCGYVSFEIFKVDGKLEDNEEYAKLTDDMKKWVKETENRFWTPSVFTLPSGMIYPVDDDGIMKWAYSKMVDIPEEEREKYPDGAGDFYKKKYDVKNPNIYDEFIFALSELNSDSKNED